MNNQVACPKCHSADIKKLLYSSQGGLIWTPFLNFMKCRKCGVRFHGQTGQLNPQVPKLMRVVSVLIILGFIGLVVGLALSLPSLRESQTEAGTPAQSRPTTRQHE